MKVQIIKREIPTEISEQGGASVVIVNKETVDLETSIDETKDALIVVGDKLLIKGMFVGLFKSMQKGIERDGNARQLGDFLTLYPVPTGEFDLDKGWDPAVNGVKIRARLLNEMEIDISKWEFEDVTPGRQSFTLESIQAGSVPGVIRLDSTVEINGRNLPLTDAIRVDWALEDGTKSGTAPAAKVTSKATRADIAPEAFDELNVPGNDGKTIGFTVRGNYASAKISATLKCLEKVKITNFTYDITAPTSGTLLLTVLNPEGVLGYTASGGQRSLKGYVSVNDGDETEMTFADPTGASDFIATRPAGFQSGDVVKLKLKIDPDKPAYDQRPLTGSFTVP